MTDIETIFNSMEKTGHRFYLMSAQGVRQASAGQTISSQCNLLMWESEDGAVGHWLKILQSTDPESTFSIKAGDVTDLMLETLTAMLASAKEEGQ